MAVTEAARHEMIVALGDAIGKEPAMALAAHLPPVGWADVATRADIDHLATLMDHRFAESRSELHGEIAMLRSELHAEVAAVRVDLGAEIAAVRVGMAELEVRLTDKLTAQTRVLYGSVIATVLTIIGMGLLGG